MITYIQFDRHKLFAAACAFQSLFIWFILIVLRVKLNKVNGLVCCISTETKLKEYPVEEKEVLKILTQVNVARRQCEIVRTPLLFIFSHRLVVQCLTVYVHLTLLGLYL